MTQLNPAGKSAGKKNWHNSWVSHPETKLFFIRAHQIKKKPGKLSRPKNQKTNEKVKPSYESVTQFDSEKLQERKRNVKAVLPPPLQTKEEESHSSAQNNSQISSPFCLPPIVSILLVFLY